MWSKSSRISLFFSTSRSLFERESQIEIGSLDIACYTVHGFLITVADALRILGGNVLAQTAFTRKWQALGQTDHFHGHVFAIEGAMMPGAH